MLKLHHRATPDSLRPSMLSFLVGGIVACLLGLAADPARAQCVTNPTECENQLAGTTEWRIDGPVSDDLTGQIQGYASATSVDVGSSIDLHVTVDGGQSWTVEIYRMGWYGGDGGRLMLAVGPLVGVDQGACTVPAAFGANSSVECDWSVGYSLAVPSDWTSGIYLAKLENASGYQAYIQFVVRDDARTATYLYEQAVMNFQAYNRYPNGASTSISFYNGGSGVQSWEKTLSFDRPYSSHSFNRNNQSPFSTSGDGSAAFFTWDYPMIQWLESQGYDVVYSTNVDVHADPNRLLDFRGIISVGHDEYWSDEMATAFSAARDAGVNLGFFSGNHVFGTVSMSASTTGTPNRVMTGLTKAGGPGVSSSWWDHPDYPDKIKRQALVGQANTGCCVRKPIGYANLPWIVDVADHWVFEGTGFANGDSVPALLGYEPDSYDPSFPAPANLHFTLLSASPFTTVAAGAASPSDTSFLNPWQLDYAHSTIYQAPSGAWVFSAGSTDWSWGLAMPFASGPPPYDPAIGDGLPTSQGFAEDFSLSGGGTLIADDLGQPAWEVDGNAGRATWTRPPGLEGTEAQGLLDGFTFTTVFRMISGGYITNYYASGGRRYLPIVGLSGGDLVVELEGGGTHTVASGAAATEYHTHSVRYDPVTDLATYSFDGVDIETWSGSSTSQSGFIWGQGSSGITGVARFRSVAFGPTNPLAPDPRIQTMTANIMDRLGSQYDPRAPITFDASLGDGLPLRQGWTDYTSDSGTGSLVQDGGASAWLADGLAGRASWTMIASPATQALAASQGWRITSVLRVATGGFVTDYYADGSRRFLPTLSLVGGNLEVQLEGGGTHVLATGAAATDFHTHEVRFDPATDLATYLFDGTPIETWAGSATTQNQISFGQGSSSTAGSAYYRSMSFELLAPIPPVPALSPVGMVALLLLIAVAVAATRRPAATRGG